MYWKCVVIIPPESARDDIPEMIAGIMEPFEGDWKLEDRNGKGR